MKDFIKSNWAWLGIIIVMIMSMCSCGARKVVKTETKEETHSSVADNSIIENKSETNVKTTATVKVDDKNETVTEETVYEPSNNTKESFVIEKDGTKIILNNAKKIVRKKTQNNNTKTELVSKTDELKKEAVKEEKYIVQKTVSVKENSSKEIKKDQFNPVKSMIIVFIMLLVLYCIYRIYKKLPLFPKL